MSTHGLIEPMEHDGASIHAGPSSAAPNSQRPMSDHNQLYAGAAGSTGSLDSPMLKKKEREVQALLMNLREDFIALLLAAHRQILLATEVIPTSKALLAI